MGAPEHRFNYYTLRSAKAQTIMLFSSGNCEWIKRKMHVL